METVESRRPLSASGSGAATAHIVVPDCELGQAISADGCRDIVVKSETGSSVNLRLAFADTHCRSVYEHLRLANSRAREHRLSASPELREGLRLAHAECRLREEHIEACSAAGYFAAGGAGPGALRRYRSGLAACYKLTRIYRELIAQGLTRIP